MRKHIKVFLPILLLAFGMTIFACGHFSLSVEIPSFKITVSVIGWIVFRNHRVGVRNNNLLTLSPQVRQNLRVF